MPQLIIEQPDGAYGVFSTVVDSWVLVDATRDEIVEHFAQRAYESERLATLRHFERVDAGIQLRSNLTFEEAERLSAEHGQTLAQIRAEAPPADQETTP